MEKCHFAQRAVLATGIAGAILASAAAGPVFAGHGLTMKEHPLRGHFPAATNRVEIAPSDAADIAEVRPAHSQEDVSGGWLRGDFPTAAESQREAMLVVTRGLGETWNCSVNEASAKDVNIGTTQAVMRVIHLAQ